MAVKKKTATKKSSSGSDPKSKKTVQKKMGRTMHEFKQHQLKSSSGEKVKNPKQAIAIALSEARKSGAKIPPNPNQKKSSSKKAPLKKATDKKSSAKKASAKKTAAKKTATKKR